MTQNSTEFPPLPAVARYVALAIGGVVPVIAAYFGDASVLTMALASTAVLSWWGAKSYILSGLSVGLVMAAQFAGLVNGLRLHQGIIALAVWLVIVLTMRAARANYDRLHRLAWSDCLTQLANRRFIDAELQALWQECGATQRPLAVIMIDIDHFKHVNDTFGHAVGDQVLRDVAQTIQTVTPTTWHCGRWGGEEFIMFGATDSVGTVKGLAHSLRKALQDSDIAVPVTVSCGSALDIPHQWPTVHALLAAADAALYAAKAAGRDTSRVSPPRVSRQVRRASSARGPSAAAASNTAATEQIQAA